MEIQVMYGVYVKKVQAVHMATGKRGNYGKTWKLQENVETMRKRGNYRKMWKLQENVETTGKCGNYRKTWKLQENVETVDGNQPA